MSTYGCPVTVPKFINTGFAKVILVKYTVIRNRLDDIHATNNFTESHLQEKKQ
jgi:hypothetical protein